MSIQQHAEWIEDFRSTTENWLMGSGNMWADMFCKQCGCLGSGECSHAPLDKACGLDVSGKCYCCEKYNQLKKDSHAVD